MDLRGDRNSAQVVSRFLWHSFVVTACRLSNEEIQRKAQNVICLWYNDTAEEAARFYAETFPNSAVTAVHRAPGDYPGGKQGQVLTVEFTVVGVPCLGLNGGPAFKHSEAFSFQIITEDRPKPIVTGMRLSTAGEPRASVAGARTDGACPGRSPRGRS